MNLRRIALISFLACLLGGFVCAQGARPALGQPTDSVELDLSPDIATWDINAANDGIALRVTGPRDFVYQAAHAPGDPVFFDFVDDTGAPLADGLYHWEIVLTPSGALRPRREGEGAVRQETPAYSGTFSIEAGLAVSPDISEQGLRPRDIVHSDDVIANFSLCVGFDCINGENFGADTIRLKENNLRIHFDDTSNSASFPNKDWRLTANDQANGGADRFSIDDASLGRSIFNIFGGAPSNSLTIDSAGDIGIGTNNAVVELHVVDGDTPTLRLEQNGSSGFQPQTWDVAGNETNFFVRDATNGSPLPFKIRPGAPNNALVIDPDGEVGLGAGTNPSASLHLLNSDNSSPTQVLIEDQGGGSTNKPGFLLRSADAASGGDWAFEVDGAGNFQVDFRPSAGPELVIADNTATNGAVTVNGNLNVGGTLTKGGGAFKIDHPLDPENKYLSHSFVESPEMINIYNGNVALDENGEAWVEMPEWFQALNREFRYQLTSIGAAAPELHVAEELVDNRFKIGGGLPHKRVSWQVTGVRQDPWAQAHRIAVEELKPESLRGTYLHPDVYENTERRAESATETQRESAPVEKRNRK